METNRLVLAMDILVIILLISSLLYFYSKKEDIQYMVNDPCTMCMDKHKGVICSIDLFNNQQGNKATPINYTALNRLIDNGKQTSP
jgi:hypothetical protein